MLLRGRRACAGRIVALLRYLAQLEQARAHDTGVVFDRDWLLDAYAEGLQAVKGERPVSDQTSSEASSGTARGGRSRR